MRIDQDAFASIYNKYFGTLCCFLNYYARDADMIQDVVQDVFAELWQTGEGREIAHVKTYLYSSARNRMLNRLRDDTRHAVLLSRWAEMELDKERSIDCVNREMFCLLLQSAVQVLPGRCKEMYLMSREQKLSYKEIASKENISIKTVENNIVAALKGIREYMTRHYAEIALP